MLLAGDIGGTRTRLALYDESAGPLLTADEHRFWRSLKEIQRFVERTPGLVVIPGHDAETWPTLDSRY